MPVYFKDFPKIQYNMDKDASTFVTATNILLRFQPLDSILRQAIVYYPYQIKDGERPDIVSHKMYGTVDYDWIILLFNQKLDPYFSWPLSSDEFSSYVDDKYGSISTAVSTIHHYEKIIQPADKLYDGTIIQERTLVIDQTNYYELSADVRKRITSYDYEMSINESKRNIQILDSVYIPQVLSEKERIFG